jgi:hypothetical protein
MSTTKTAAKKASPRKAASKVPAKKSGKATNVPKLKVVGQVPSTITANKLVPPLNGKQPKQNPPRLEDIDRIAIVTIMNAPAWTLVDRNLFLKQGQSSKVYIALRRRGFDVVVRHFGGIKNYWSRWPHEVPTIPSIPLFEGDDEGMYGAAS